MKVLADVSVDTFRCQYEISDELLRGKSRIRADDVIEEFMLNILIDKLKERLVLIRKDKGCPISESRPFWLKFKYDKLEGSL